MKTGMISFIVLLFSANAWSAHICDSNLNWYQRWGSGVGRSTAEPPVSACRPNGYSRLVRTEHMVHQEDGTDVYVGSLEAKNLYKGNKLNGDVSFLIPSEFYGSFDHVGVFAAYDRTTYNRAGAAVYKDGFFVEVVDAVCFPDNHLMGFVPFATRLKADHWYRVFTLVARENGSTRTKVIVGDVHTGEILGSSQVTKACDMSWAGGRNSTFFLGLMMLNNPKATGLFDDFEGKNQ